MKWLKMKLLIAVYLLFVAGILQAQTWSHGSSELRTGMSSAGLGGASPANGSLLFYNSSNTNTVSFQSGATSASYSMTLPTAQATSGDVLQNIGPGTLVWTTVSGITNVYEASLTLTAGQIQTLYSANSNTGYQIVAAPGAGKYIEVISASFVYTYTTSPYTTNAAMYLINNGAAAPQASCQLGATLPRIERFGLSGPTFNTQSQILENTSLQVANISGDPSGGSGSGVVKVIYRIVTI